MVMPAIPPVAAVLGDAERSMCELRTVDVRAYRPLDGTNASAMIVYSL